MPGRKIVGIIYNPYVLINIWAHPFSLACSFQKTQCVIAFPKNIKLNFTAISAIDRVSNRAKICRFRIRPFCHNQMVFRLDLSGLVSSGSHPLFIHIALF